MKLYMNTCRHNKLSTWGSRSRSYLGVKKNSVLSKDDWGELVTF